MDSQRLTINILVAMALGLLVGIALFFLNANNILTDTVNFIVHDIFDTVGQIFVRLLKLMVVPLVFVSLVCGASALGSGSNTSRIGIKTIILYMMTTAIAVILALSLANLFNPGEGLALETASEYTGKDAPSIKDTIIDIFPNNPIAAMNEGKMLQVIVFALLFGVALARVGKQAEGVLGLFTQLNEVVMKMVIMLMHVAPIGIFCLVGKLFAITSYGAIFELGMYFLTVVLALFLHGIGVYALLVTFLARLNPIQFLKKMLPVQMFAFSTASSNATIPVTLETVEEKLGVNNKVASFTIPLGATINMDGTAIMQGVATVFIAQAYGVDIGIAGYLAVIATATLASVGTAGVPGVGLITLALVLQQVNLPVEGISLIIGIDRLLDMIRTAVNVTGDAAVTCVVARSEQAIDLETFNQDDDPLATTEATSMTSSSNS